MAHKNTSNYSPYKARRQQAASTNSVSTQPPRPVSTTHHGKHRRPDTIYELPEAMDRLSDIFRNHGADKYIGYKETEKLAQYYRLLMQNQEMNNFTRLLKIRDIGIRHFIDSLYITQLVSFKFPLLDLGTGPGLPGIPLKIHFPAQKILLAEGVQKRVEFLKKVRLELNLTNLDILGRNINSEFVYPVQGVISRAVEDLRNTLQNVLSCVQVGGHVYFMKGPGVDPEINMVKSSPIMKYYRLIEDVAYELPHTPHQRRLVIFEKIKNAPLPDEDDDFFAPWSTEMRIYMKDRGESL